MTAGRALARPVGAYLLGGGVPLLAALVLLTRSDLPSGLRLGGSVAIVAWFGGVAAILRARSRFRVRTLANVAAGLREGDHSLRVRAAGAGDPFGPLVDELNQLADALQQQRLRDLEASLMLRKVLGEIDAAVYAFDDGGRLRHVNPAGARLLDAAEGALLGRDAADLGLAGCLAGEPSRTVELDLPSARGRWELRRGTFHQEGRPLRLLVLLDLRRALRREQLDAWRRLIRVVAHELNNSLAPIQSLSSSLDRLVPASDDEWRADLADGLRVIGSRATALSRFMASYSRLAKMPEPSVHPVAIAELVDRVVRLARTGGRTAVEVRVAGGPDVSVAADADQLEQALINLVQNAVDASSEAAAPVEIGWRLDGRVLDLWVRDRGCGLPDSPNLLVPFFTTKPGGSGIGLLLCQQVAEGHGGHLELADRADGAGCEAHLRLPTAGPERLGGSGGGRRGIASDGPDLGAESAN